jgi:hypothetical protein
MLHANPFVQRRALDIDRVPEHLIMVTARPTKACHERLKIMAASASQSGW